jgi:hypothetical protein
MTPGSALNRLALWIRTNTQLIEALAQTNYRTNQRMFTSRQVALIFEYLGEPWPPFFKTRSCFDLNAVAFLKKAVMFHLGGH